MVTIRKYQNEKPVNTDLFSGQGHSQVAEAIASVLLSDDSQHIIGIEGNLGAGKSTVINILQQQIVDNGFHVVTFDADQYHTTLKSALIQTIEKELKSLLEKKDLYKHAKLTSAVETALGKRLEYTKDTTSHISFPAIIFAFSLGVSALQLKPSLKFFFEFVNNTPNLDKLSGWLSIALFSSPVIVYLIMKMLGVKTRLGDLVKRNSTDTISETIDINREVGAIELKDAFATFSSLIPKGKTLLLVVDNIDRVSPDIARELWSDIEILTSLGSERFRILLPYSEEHLAKALEKSSVDESQSGKEFISKRIPVPFSAPPIVTTGWREQFEEYWGETLPDISGQEGVKDLIEIWAKKITPRYLKSIVNRIGAKIDSCPEANELLCGTACAAYLIVVRDSKLTITQLLSEPKNTSQSVAPTDLDFERQLKATHKVLLKYGGEKENWSKQVAALHFQTSFKVAQSELIADPIRTALNTYDAIKLIELSSLLGFDVLFRQQLTTTNASDLVKISDALTQEENGKELVNKYLGDINHEIRYSPNEDYTFDEDLIQSYENLQDIGINLDLKLLKHRQNQVTKTIMKMWRVMQPLTSTLDLEKAKYKWNDLENTVKQCFAHCRVSGTLPSFIKKPSSDFVVNALFPIAEDLEQWNILNLIQSLRTDELVTAAAKRQKLLDSSDDIFSTLLKKMRIGELDGLSTAELLADINVSSTDIDELLNQLPFTNSWYEPSNKTYHQQLAQELENSNRTGEFDENTLNAHTALCAAAFVNELTPSDHINLRQPNGQQRSHKSSVWLATKLQERPGSSRYLTNYLSSCKFAKVLTWCKESQVSAYLLPHLEELIENKRVFKLDINSLLIEDYKFLKNNTQTLTPKSILDWMNAWGKHQGNNHLDWCSEVVDDIILYETNNYLSTLKEYLDNQLTTQEDWLIRIKKNHPILIRMAEYLSETSYVLINQKPLQQALKTLPALDHNYNVELVQNLTKLIDGNQRNGIRISLMSTFFKTSTALETRYRIIRYFGTLINMPKINESSIEIEAIALLDDSISNKNNAERDWLLAQPIDESGWNISEWSIGNLKALYNLLNDDDETRNTKLITLVEKTIDKAVGSNRTNNVA
ncbi:P-loop NTPase fold protein [Vibrio chagasii]|uniref:AAA family ATPase n=1 Tax=Vibrio chagasii TaxID=170679 RepID=A0A7Y4DQR1_9VIBR|nr:P-loop NTPase fold protein [Vibrio chagasii]NOH32860.1 AAA family ATPase [Vibrio chagasii]